MIKRLFILAGLLCPSFFAFSNPLLSNPPPQPVFSPIPLFLSSQQPLLPFQGESAVSPLCPKGMDMSVCLSLSSFPFLQMDNIGDEMTSSMFTSFFSPEESITFSQMDQLLNTDEWESYDYSFENYSFKKRGKPGKSIKKGKTKVKAPSTGDKKGGPSDRPSEQGLRIHVHKTSDQVIKEETVDGQTQIEKGKIKAAPYEDIMVSEGKIAVKPSADTVDLTANKQNSVDCSLWERADTEAGAGCIECAQFLENEDLVSRTKAIGKQLRNKLQKKNICSPNMNVLQSIRSNFDRTCDPLKFDSFIQKISCQACKENIPPTLLLAIMTLESSGQCEAEDSKSVSVGLFQINAKFSEIPQCKKDRELNRKPTSLCLQNLKDPDVNLKESLRIIKEKYRYVGNRQQPAFQCNTQQGMEDMDLWRKTMAAYNGGQKRISHLKKLITKPPSGITPSAWDKASEWQKMRIYYFHCNKRDMPSCKIPGENKFFRANHLAVSNLIYVESLFGAQDPSSQPTVFNEWKRFSPHLNGTRHCSP